MTDLFKNEDGETITEFAGVEVPFKFLTEYGVLEFCRIGMGMDPLCVAEGRGRHKANTNNGGVGQMAKKLLTKDGLDWVKQHKLTQNKPKLRVAEVFPDEPEEEESEELDRLIKEQETEMVAAV